MNTAQKLLSTAAFTILLILLAGASLHGQSYRYVFYQNSTSALHTLYAQTACDSNCLWSDVNWGVSAASGSAMTAVNMGAGTQFFYVGTGQQIEMIDNVNPTATWSVGVCISCNTGAPAAAAGSALTSAVDYSAVVTHVFYEGTNGHIYHLYCACTALTPTWHWDDVMSLAGGAPVAASGSALTSFVDNSGPTGIVHVFYLGTNANVYQLYWTTAWHSADPTSLAGAPVAGSLGSLTSFIGSGVVHVFYLSGQNVHELYWNGSWHTDDATSQAGAPSNAAGSALTSFVNTTGVGDTGMHVMYSGTNEHLDALHSMSSPVWAYFDATASSGGVPGVSGSHLASFQDALTGGVRLYFIGQNSHVYELYWPSEGTASETDLTASSGAAAPAAGSALAGVDSQDYKP